MPQGSRRVDVRRGRIRGVVQVALAMVVLSALISVRAAEQPTADDLGALRRAVDGRFDVVPLTTGIALVGRSADRRVEIARGVVSSAGVPLSGEELRRRFGADADLVLRLSYLPDVELQRLFAPPPRPAMPTPAPVDPAPSVSPAPPSAAAAPGPPDAPVAPDAPVPPEPPRRRSGARIGFAKPMTVAIDEEVRDGVFSLGGDVRVEGRVRDDVVVIGARLELAPTAEVRGDITVVGGSLVVADGARHFGRIHRVSDADWPRWSGPGVNWAWFEPRGAGRWLGAVGSFVRITLLALAVLALTALAGGRMARIGAAAGAAPIKSALVGLTAELLFVPLLVLGAILLAVTIIGIPFVVVLVPLALVTMFVAMLVGITGVALRLGRTIGDRLNWHVSSPTAMALVGIFVIVLPTLVFQALALAPGPLPVRASLAVASLLEYVAWTIGLGATLLTGFGRWAVVPPPVPPAAYDSMAEAPSTL